ncbi:uncharacterized protein FOMMEDRAFT_157796 [Fomitiporia mediterranea MF3/22]|uniref:uncharacterized protein n=1 Tax=Fomitiporia mediterranea (strain MF3/22) TaxID=694068 RepID=UPI0004408B42|nr:uncharacterized protein FOMMEDRAFT_157796 [Fomitiporia mediterranea MF3/22]EJD00699.1 hypothetical protein FOMMEDRAFT_157796 [Fomitiporia mediterranea MF3/22]
MPGESLSKSNGQLGSGPSTVLPTEILAEVFECCLPSSLERLETPLQRLAPLVLTWVCKAWRDLCLSIPTLWTDLAVGHRGSDPVGDIRILKIWLSRSRYLSISLKLNYEIDDALRPVLFNQDKNERYVNGMYQLLGLAIRCIERWSTFEIHTLDISVLDQVFLAIVTRGSPWLVNLSFSTKYLGFFGDVHVLDFSKCPSLKSICLRSPMISPVAQSATMKNMTRLELRFCSSVDDCLRWIDICPALEQLIVRLFCSNPELLGREIEWLPEQRPRCIPRLKELEVHNFSIEADAGPLLDVLDVPALTSLKVNMYDMIDAPGHWTHVTDLVRRSRPPLETLELQGTPMSIEDIIRCLDILPSIKQLSIGTRRPTDELIKALSVDAQQEETPHELSTVACLCPSLKVLDLVNTTWSLDLLANSVFSRCNGKSTVTFLEELRLSSENSRNVMEHPAFVQSRARGLKIVERETNLLISAFTSPDVVFV